MISSRRSLLILAAVSCASRLYHWQVTLRHTPPFPHASEWAAQEDLLLGNGKREPATCLAFRASHGCEWDGPRAPLWDLGCDEPIPRNAAGYCEYLLDNGTSLPLFRKSCTYFKTAKSASCRLALKFASYKREALAFVPEPPIHTGSGKGIVMAIYPSQLISVFAIIRLLREHHQCQLPIEVWSLPREQKEMSGNLLKKILGLGKIIHRSIDDGSITGFMVKPYAIMQSQFQQVLWLDADNLPVRDPSYLFDTTSFKSTGTLFWNDYWQPDNTVFDLDERSLLWELLGIAPRNELEQESGQLLLDKGKNHAALNNILFLTFTFGNWLEPLGLLWGDKDLFRMGFYMAETNVSWVPTPPAPLGYIMTADGAGSKNCAKLHKNSGGSTTCGVVMLQYDPDGRPVFAHRNSFKLLGSAAGHKYSSRYSPVFESLYQFKVNGDPSEQYRIASTKDLTQKVTCYHPDASVAKFFQEHSVSRMYPEIQSAEQAFLQYAAEGMGL